MSRRADLTGQVFGDLTAMHHIKGRKWACKCACGATAEVDIDKLRRGHTSSCGHKRVEALVARSTKHGQAKRKTASPEYRTWCSMVQRCTNPENKAWKHYGGRNLTVCPEWATFEQFYADMGPRPKGASLDRIDNNRGYAPDNCRWATRAEQARNTSRNRTIRYAGTDKCVADWAATFGIPTSYVYYWLGRYGDVEAIRRLHKKYSETTIKLED